MNLLNIPPSDTRSLDAMRRRLEWLEAELEAQTDTDGFESPSLAREITDLRAELFVAERKALRLTRK